MPVIFPAASFPNKFKTVIFNNSLAGYIPVIKSSLTFFSWSVGLLPKRSILVAHRGMLGLRAWGDGLVVVLFEFLDDDTKLAQSCTDWLHVQRWHTVVPEPPMRVTLWALMTSKPSSMRLDGYLCEVFHTTFLSAPFCGRFSVKRLHTAAHWSGSRSEGGYPVARFCFPFVIPRSLC